jgi:flagellar basal-body rod modification protein FlgD
MSQISQAATTSFTAQESAAQAGGSSDAYSDIDIDEFLALMIAELQNQDPLDPMDNSEMVQQIGQIREIGATDQLTKTLTDLSSSQELVTASSLIGQQVTGLALDGSPVDGIIDRITVETDPEKNERSIKVHVGGKTMNIKNIREIQTGQTLPVDDTGEEPS